MTPKKILSRIKEVGIFEFISQNGHELSKEELIKICKEMAYIATEGNYVMTAFCQDRHQQNLTFAIAVIDSLKENAGWSSTDDET